MASTLSTNIATSAKLVSAAVKAFDAYVGIPFAGIFLAAAASVYTAFKTAKAQAAQLRQLREGGRVPLSGRSHERGGHRIEGTDIVVERGEHVINAISSEKYDPVLEAINDDDPKRAFMALLQQGGFGLPEIVVKQIRQPGFVALAPGPGFDARQIEAAIHETNRRIDTLIGYVGELPKSQIVGLADGSVLEKEKGRTTITKPKGKQAPGFKTAPWQPDLVKLP